MSWLRFAKPTHAVIHGNDGVNLYIFIPPLCGWHSFSASRKAHLGTIEGNFTHVTGRTDGLTHSLTEKKCDDLVSLSPTVKDRSLNINKEGDTKLRCVVC